MFILGLTESSIVSIALAALGLFTSLMGVFLRYKSKADNADTMKQVNVKIKDSESKLSKELEEDLKPIKNDIEKHEKNFNDFKRETIEPIKSDVAEIKIDQHVMKESFKNLESLINRNHNEIKDLLSTKDKHDREEHANLWKTVHTKEDKKK